MQVMRTIKACCASREYAGAHAAVDRHSITFNKNAQKSAYLVRVSHLDLLVWVTHRTCCLRHAVSTNWPIFNWYHHHQGQNIVNMRASCVVAYKTCTCCCRRCWMLQEYKPVLPHPSR